MKEFFNTQFFKIGGIALLLVLTAFIWTIFFPVTINGKCEKSVKEWTQNHLNDIKSYEKISIDTLYTVNEYQHAQNRIKDYQFLDSINKSLAKEYPALIKTEKEFIKSFTSDAALNDTDIVKTSNDIIEQYETELKKIPKKRLELADSIAKYKTVVKSDNKLFEVYVSHKYRASNKMGGIIIQVDTLRLNKNFNVIGYNKKRI